MPTPNLLYEKFAQAAFERYTREAPGRCTWAALPPEKRNRWRNVVQTVLTLAGHIPPPITAEGASRRARAGAAAPPG